MQAVAPPNQAVVILTENQLESLLDSKLRQLLTQILPQASPRDRLLTRKETAEYFQVSLPTLREWEKKGDIKPIRKGNRVYFRESELTHDPDREKGTRRPLLR